jgi:hypothetical protein
MVLCAADGDALGMRALHGEPLVLLKLDALPQLRIREDADKRTGPEGTARAPNVGARRNE